jgi:hypothetical protein
MIKGVNKQVLEINETQNSFFEKAIFFVKPEYCGMSEGKLRESAKKEFECAGSPPSQKNRRRFDRKALLIFGCCFLLGLAVGFWGSSSF